MDTARLQSFCVIVETGSLTRAAELLHVSHSALSKGMGVLQRELGIRLFQPRGRGLELTEAGGEVYRKSKALLEQVEDLRKAGSQAAARVSPTRIALSEALSILLTGPLAAQMSGPAEFQQFDSGGVAAAVLDSKADFGAVFVPFPHPTLEFLPITKVRMGVFKLTGRFEGTAPERIPFVVPTNELGRNPLGILARDGWPEGVSRSVSFGASNLAIALSLVESGVAAAYIPSFLARALNRRRGTYPTLREIPFADRKVAIDRKIYLVKRIGRPESREMRALAKLVRRLA